MGEARQAGRLAVGRHGEVKIGGVEFLVDLLVDGILKHLA